MKKLSKEVRYNREILNDEYYKVDVVYTKDENEDISLAIYAKTFTPFKGKGTELLVKEIGYLDDMFDFTLHLINKANPIRSFINKINTNFHNFINNLRS